MTKGSIGSRPRREFLKLAALAGAAVFSVNESAADTISRSDSQASAIEHNGVPGTFCTSLHARNWHERSLEWHVERSIRLSRL